uniref:Ovule protein n=1 Tax=Brugia timori TaxID=42155 RepID=A0A0R3QFU6_9BILA
LFQVYHFYKTFGNCFESSIHVDYVYLLNDKLICHLHYFLLLLYVLQQYMLHRQHELNYKSYMANFCHPILTMLSFDYQLKQA